MADCYSGPNPLGGDDERMAIWKWAKENGIDQGLPIEQVSQAINDHFFAGQAKPEWIRDIISGRKTPFHGVTNDAWKKQYNRRMAVQQAKEISQLASLGPVARNLRRLLYLPRSIAVFGHGIVFPVTHAGDLAFRPASWGTFIKGTLRTYRGALVPSRFGGGKAYTGEVLASIRGDDLYDLALRSGVDVGVGSHPAGLISRTYTGPAQRAWDMLTVMRYNLWKKAVQKHIMPGMTEKEQLDIGQHLAVWANHATGSGKGPIASFGGNMLFGPKLTQSKISRLVTDPIQTVKTFAHWSDATPGEKAAAMTRLSGATQYLLTKLGFLAVNAGVLEAANQKDKINFFNPLRADFLQFKGNGIVAGVPGLSSEIRTLSKILAVAYASKHPNLPYWVPAQVRQELTSTLQQANKGLKGGSKLGGIADTLGQYGMAKLMPTYGRGIELATGQNWRGQPLPWSHAPGTSSKPRLSWGEYAGSVGPIPLSGATGYVYDQIKKNGGSSLDASQIVKGLVILGLGAPGLHAREEYAPRPTARKSTRRHTRRAHSL